MTNHWVDIKNADVIFIMGGNPAEAHPVGFRWVIEARDKHNAKVICIDPRYTRTASVSDLYVPLRSGSDIAFLGGLINYLLTNDKIQRDYVMAYTDFTFIVKEEYAFDDGIASGYDPAKRTYDRSSWDYETGEDGFVKTDPTLQNPRCVYQLLKRHYSRYTPEMVAKITGSPPEKFAKVCEWVSSTATPTRAMTILYALGWTEHTTGPQIIRCAAMLQLLLGNVGIAGGGVNALRGHSNIQGLTDLGLMCNLLPGYVTLPKDSEQTHADYVKARAPKPMRPGQMSYMQNFPKFFNSFMKAWWGDAATPENNFAYDYLPKMDRLYDAVFMYEQMIEGKVHGYVCQGFNPIAAAPDKAKMLEAFSKLKFLVVMDPLATETSEFWRNYGEHNNVDSSQIQTEVIRLPTNCFAEEDGCIVNSGRWMQWHWKGANPPGEARTDIEIMSDLYLRLRELYQKEGGAFPDPILNLSWPYAQAHNPTPEELAREYSGKALADVTDPKDPTKVIRKAGEQVAGFAELRDDGSTSCGCWIYAGSFGPTGNLMTRRDNSDPSGLGNTLGWTYAWPANRRVLYSRASCDPSGKPWDPKRVLIRWDGRAWSGIDVPDFPAGEAPENGMGPFIMNPEGVARFFSRGMLAEGPFPEHYEPFETPLGYNPLHPQRPEATSNPASRIFPRDRARLGTAKEFPYVATTYRITEHFHFWTQHNPLNSITQPEQFIEMSEVLAKDLGIKAGDLVRVASKRGYIKAVAVVTKRLKPMTIDGKVVHTIGIPLTWGYTGLTKRGYLVNTLTPVVGDPNVETPEYKTFLVNVAKA